MYVKENYLKICGKISERMHNFHTHSFEYFGGWTMSFMWVFAFLFVGTLLTNNSNQNVTKKEEEEEFESYADIEKSFLRLFIM